MTNIKFNLSTLRTFAQVFRGHILTLSPFLKFGSFATKADLSFVSLSQRVTAGREGEQSNLKDLQFSHSVASRRL